MNVSLTRRILGTLAGAAIGLALIETFELISSKVYPFPPGVSLENREAIATWIATLPAGALLLVLAGWFTGTLAGSLVATRIAHSPIAGLLVATLLIVAGVVTVLTIPHPAWFLVAAAIAYALATWAGVRLGVGSTRRA
jgi:hypothetical protein